VTTYTPDMLALLKAIAANPDEDTPRLMYADACEEYDPARAELIRLQVKIAIAKRSCRCASCVTSGQHHNGPCAGSRVYVDSQSGVRAHAREQAILREHEVHWRAGMKCEKCRGSGKSGGDEISGNQCTVCHGTGDAGGLLRKVGYDRHNEETGGRKRRHDWFTGCIWNRGFIERVLVPQVRDLVEEGYLPNTKCEMCNGTTRVTQSGPYRVFGPGSWTCSACNGTGKKQGLVPTDFARSLLDTQHSPERALISQLIPLDRQPYKPAGLGDLWYWRRDCPNFPEPSDSTIPSPVFDHLPGVTDTVIATHQPSREQVVSALGRAFATFTRLHLTALAPL